jgi:hypothetical protein
MKAKVFRGEDSNIEKELNKWLLSNNIEVIWLSQSSKGGNLVVITIIYK